MWKMLSSATDAITQSSSLLEFQLKSETLFVWPPWMNYTKSKHRSQYFSYKCGNTSTINSKDFAEARSSKQGSHQSKQASNATLRIAGPSPTLTRSSGGPSSASSAVCSLPMWLKSHTAMRRSADADANTDWLNGDHWTCCSQRGDERVRLRYGFSSQRRWTVVSWQNFMYLHQLVCVAVERVKFVLDIA